MNKFKGKKVAVIGLGIEGLDAINYLISQDAIVTLLDKKAESEIDFNGIDKNDIEIIAGENYLSNLDEYEYLVRSPGVYRFLPEIVEAETKGLIVTSAVKIFFDECKAKVIGITGTKGKGTTSTLIYEILKADGQDIYLAGNIGKPYLELLPKLSSNSFVVMEMSSFQLIDLDKSPHISVVLNITSDHMDWHLDINEYIKAKKNIVSHQIESDFAVINEEYKVSKSFGSETKGNVVFFSKQKLDNKFKEKLLLRGEHNLENIAAAVSVSKILNIDDKKTISVLQAFKGLEHRLELVAEVDGKTFYNDSFATGPDATIAAINSFTEPITIILGGSDKGLGYSELGKVIGQKDNLKNVILIGDIGQKIGNHINGKNLINLGHDTMIRIVEAATKVTEKGGVVILSPAAASFDMFKNYKDRGNQFKESVLKLKNV